METSQILVSNGKDKYKGKISTWATCARCMEKRDISLTLWDTLRQIIWTECPFLATIVTNFSGQEMVWGITFQHFKNNSKSTLLSFQDKKGLGNPQQTSSFRTCFTPEHTIKIQNLLDLVYFKATCSKYQRVKEKNTKIQFSKSVFGKQENFSRLGQIRASLMVAELPVPATGDNDDEMVVVMRTTMIKSS